MRKILNKYSCVFFFFIGGFVVFADGVFIPPPKGIECCKDIEAEPNEPGYDEYKKCLDYYTANPDASCETTVPIDNSRYIYISIVAGVALASFVIARRIKT